MIDTKTVLHPRNRHRGRYDFKQLKMSCPALTAFVSTNSFGDESIDFANPEAVKTLNRAILIHFYGIREWDIPNNYLCPPIPGRADYIHHIADLLAFSNQDVLPKNIRVLDIGVGANCVYPIIGQAEYGWKFLGSDIDPVAVASAKKIVDSNPTLKDSVEVRLQPSPANIFKGLLKPAEFFDVTICNPPFHASAAEAEEGSRRKWKNLGRGSQAKTAKAKAPLLNFGGQSTEIWCAGGERAFVRRMIEESIQIRTQCFWFTSIISKESHLPVIFEALERAHVFDSRVMEMAQGQKKTRLVAWTFFDELQQEKWRQEHQLHF